jgi:predicted PurR-regulated permease PerM
VTIEREGAVLVPGPVPGGRPKLDDQPATIARMPDAQRIVVPRWIQLVTLPLLLLFVWVVVGAVRHAVFLFMVAALVALLLDPLVRVIIRLRIPRGISIAIVYLSFAAALAVTVFAVGAAVVNEATTAAERVNTYVTEVNGQTGQTAADQDVDRLQRWLNDHGLERVKVRTRGHDLVQRLRERNISGYTDDVVRFLEGAALSVFQILISGVLILVVSIYMLLDMGRLRERLDRRFPPRDDMPSLVLHVEKALAGYVKGQVLLSLIIGSSAGLALYLLGTFGWAEGMQRYALLFGAWVALMELIPYLGPWLGAIPPLIYALVVDPPSALWVALLFLGIHQIEGHVVVPKVMGSALRLHPLLVIFGLLAGAEIYGLPGIFVALPLLAVIRALWEFFSDRIELEPWQPGEPAVPIEIEPPAEVPRPPAEPAPRPVAPVSSSPAPPAQDPPAAARR